MQYSIFIISCFIFVDTQLQFKRDSSATGSWSIQDEIRRVRSRATEEMLRTLPSSKIDWSALAADRNNVNSSAIEDIGARSGEKVQNFTNLDTTANMASGLGSQVIPGMILLQWESLCFFLIVNPFNIRTYSFILITYICLECFTLTFIFLPIYFKNT